MHKDTDSLFITGNSIDKSSDAEYECPECGSPIGLGETYCKKCGTELDWGDDYEEEDNYQNVENTAALARTTDSQVINKHFADNEEIRVLCPQCNESIKIGVTVCPHCGVELEWDSGDDTLVSFNGDTGDCDGIHVRDRVPVDYGIAKLNYNSYKNGIQSKAVRARIPDTYPAPEMEYNSFGEYL